MSSIKAVVFDADGTLLNSFELIVAAYAHVAGLHGFVAPSVETVRAQLGRALPDIYKTLFPEGDLAQMLRDNSAFIASNAATSAAYAGLHEMLAALQSKDLKIGIVTGGNHKIHDLLDHHEITQHFLSVVHCDRVTFSKPHPEGVLLALEELDATPGQTVMVGDSVQDIQAAKNAGLAAAIAITHGFGKREDLEQAGADYMVDSLAELTVLLQKVSDK